MYRDVTAGLMSGVKSATKGILAGATALILAPILGAKDGGRL